MFDFGPVEERHAKLYRDLLDAPNMAAIQSSGNAPTSPLESAIMKTLSPGAYTAIVRGKGAVQGVGLVEVYKK